VGAIVFFEKSTWIKNGYSPNFTTKNKKDVKREKNEKYNFLYSRQKKCFFLTDWFSEDTTIIGFFIPWVTVIGAGKTGLLNAGIINSFKIQD
jgi:hypothetical protein